MNTRSRDDAPFFDPSGAHLDEDYPLPLNVDRRDFLQTLGAGLLVSVTAREAAAQRGRGRQRRPERIAARIHVGEDGSLTVMTGKIELGQGARTEVGMAAAEELRVPANRVNVILADTDLVPDDGTTAGSRTTPGTLPPVRRAAAAARAALTELAANAWQVAASSLAVDSGVIVHPPTQRRLTYGEVAKLGRVDEAFKATVPAGTQLTPVREWKVLGVSTSRSNARDLVTGAHKYPSDIALPGMLHGKVLRPASFGATLKALDTKAAQRLSEVTVVRDGDFVGCVAPTEFAAAQAVKALAQSASWREFPQPSSDELWEHLRNHAAAPRGGRDLSRAFETAAKTLRAEYHTAYLQHAPLEPGCAVAHWEGDRLTVWATTRSPFSLRSQLARTFSVPGDRVRVIVPDSGGGFGMKSGDQVAEEAARLAKSVGKPVRVRWSREEEFTWAYFRPAALIETRAGLGADGTLVAWEFTNLNSGGSAVDTPYRIPQVNCQYRGSQSPLRPAPYRALAATANNFARESFMDELATAAGKDPFDFRLAHLDNDRLRAVLERAADKFNWRDRRGRQGGNVGVGLACGTEKGSCVAACAEVEVDRQRGAIRVRHVCEAFECGPILNPSNLRSQVVGCILMGLGGALREEIRFKDGKLLNPRFSEYEVARFSDVPTFDIQLLNRPDLEPAGAGETPIIAIAPAVANAVFHATGVRVRSLPLQGAALRG